MSLFKLYIPIMIQVKRKKSLLLAEIDSVTAKSKLHTINF